MYLTKPGLVWDTVCVYLVEYESKNEIIKYTKYFFIYIYMQDSRCADMNI